jgi:hypothetical protein
VRPSDGPVRAQGEVEIRAAHWAPPLLRVRVLECPGFGEIYGTFYRQGVNSTLCRKRIVSR